MGLSPVTLSPVSSNVKQKEEKKKENRISKLACYIFHTQGKSLITPISTQNSPFFEMALRRSLPQECYLIQNTRHLPQKWLEIYLNNPPLEKASFEDLLTLLYLNDLFLNQEACLKILKHLRKKVSDNPSHVLKGFHFYFNAPKETLPIFERFFSEPLFMFHAKRLNDKEEIESLEAIVSTSPNHPFFQLIGGLLHELKKQYEQAAIAYESAANKGIVTGFWYLSQLYIEGKGVKKDLKKALFLAEEGAIKGCNDCINLTGYLYSGIFPEIPKNKEKGEAAYQKASRLGHPIASFNLAHFKEDKSEKIALMLLSADNGYAPAQDFIGRAYLCGSDGVEKQTEKGMFYLDLAARQGNADALTMLYAHYMDEKDFEKANQLIIKASITNNFSKALLAMNLLEGTSGKKDINLGKELLAEAAKEGDSFALLSIGNLWEKEGDLEQAKVYWEKADAEDHCEAALKLGICYLKGNPPPKNLQKGFQLIKKAADLKECQAYAILAQCYRLAWGVDRNIAEAIEWYKKAIKEGYDPSGKLSLNVFTLIFEELGVAGIPEAFPYAQMAAEKENPEGMVLVGLAYRDGVQVPQDLEKAKEFFRKAAKLGNAQAKRILREMGETNCIIQ